MARRRKYDPEESGGYNWMDTYGDMVTLLLCFFVLLYSFSVIDAKKQQELVAAFSGSMNSAAIESIEAGESRQSAIQTIDTMAGGSGLTDGSAAMNQTGQGFDRLYQNIKRYISENDLGNQLSVSQGEDTIVLRFGDVFLFESGRADLLPAGQETLGDIVQIISQNSSAIKLITIEGNTDNRPIKNGEFSDNWDLSVARAVNVLRSVQEYGVIDSGKLAAVGYGEYRPVDTNLTEAGRARNRRVDFDIQKMPESGTQTADSAGNTETEVNK